MKKIIITTSWDDGSSLDMKLARLLKRYGVKGTFYITPNLAGRVVLSVSQIKELAASGMEVGAHTLTHPRLSSLCWADKRKEIEESKKRLEAIMGREVSSFSYPKGDYDDETIEIVRQAGCRYARTTACFRLNNNPDPYRMQTSVHFSRQPFASLLRHNLRLGNVKGIAVWGRLGFETDPVKLVSKMLTVLKREGGVLHLWGHSWEIERYNMWSELENCLRFLSEVKASFVINKDLIG